MLTVGKEEKLSVKVLVLVNHFFLGTDSSVSITNDSTEVFITITCMLQYACGSEEIIFPRSFNNSEANATMKQYTN